MAPYTTGANLKGLLPDGCRGWAPLLLNRGNRGIAIFIFSLKIVKIVSLMMQVRLHT